MPMRPMRQDGTPPHRRVEIERQLIQPRGRGGGERAWRKDVGNRRRDRSGVSIAKRALLFQPQDPGHLAVQGNHGRRSHNRGWRDGGLAPPRGHARHSEKQEREGANTSLARHRRMVAQRVWLYSARVDFRYLAIEGPVGVGKTTLAERLAARLDARGVFDDRENPFLVDFYSGRNGAAFQTQLFFTLARHRQLTGLRQRELFNQTTVCDYIFERDRIYAFVNLDDNELFIYQRLFELLRGTCRRLTS